jgi:hypothetical protein
LVSTNRTTLVDLGAGKPIGGGEAAVLGAEPCDQLVLLAHEPIEGGFIVGQALEVRANQRREAGALLGGADTGSVIELIVNRYSDILHVRTLSLKM